MTHGAPFARKRERKGDGRPFFFSSELYRIIELSRPRKFEGGGCFSAIFGVTVGKRLSRVLSLSLSGLSKL